MKRETLDVAAAEVRFDAEAGIVAGYGAVFGARLPFHNEVVVRGAFTRTLSERGGVKLPMLWTHDPTQVIGAWDLVAEDSHGLKVEGRILADVQRGAEVRALMKAGAVSGLSIGFRARKDGRGRDGVRMLQDVDLQEISIVAMPASPGARANYRSAAAHDAPLAAFLSAAGRAATSLRSKR